MTNTMIDLWNGNIAPWEHCGAHDSEANHLHGLMEHNRETLREGLTVAQADIFQKYVDYSEEYLLRMLELAFCEGFCAGGKLVMEIVL